MTIEVGAGNGTVWVKGKGKGDSVSVDEKGGRVKGGGSTGDGYGLPLGESCGCEGECSDVGGECSFERLSLNSRVGCI